MSFQISIRQARREVGLFHTTVPEVHAIKYELNKSGTNFNVDSASRLAPQMGIAVR
jgi:hypothetical protein